MCERECREEGGLTGAGGAETKVEVKIIIHVCNCLKKFILVFLRYSLPVAPAGLAFAM